MGPEQKQIMWFSNMFAEFVQKMKAVGKPEAEALIKRSKNRKAARWCQRSKSGACFFFYILLKRGALKISLKFNVHSDYGSVAFKH